MTPDDLDDAAPDGRDAIYAELRDGIVAGSITGQLPTRRELAQAHRVSEATIGRVVRQLKADGLVVTLGGRGTWVAKPRPRKGSGAQ